MPSVEAVPFLIAQEKGYFKDLGIEVKFHTYNNAKDRDSEIQTGTVDAVVDDVLGLLTKREAGFKVKATSTLDSSFQLLINKDKMTENPNVGLMEMSITNYLADGYLKDKPFNKVFINAIPQRLEMTVTGTTAMAVLPEPVASVGQSKGLDKETMTIEGEPSPTVLIFTEDAIDRKPNTIKALYEAYNKAVKDFEESDVMGRDLLVKTFNVSPEVAPLLTLPKYQKAYLMDEAYYTKVQTWMNENLGTKLTKTFSESVETIFVK